LVLALSVTALSSYIAQAHPYASGITNVGGTISFILNEAADTVGVYFPGNNSTNFLGNDLTAGVHSFTLGAGTNAYVITVHKTGAGGPVQISVDTSNTVLFPAPRGVAVNANPKDRHFGLIYAANSTPGDTGLAAKNRGLYVMNADTSDAFDQGTTALAPVFSSASSSSPYRIGIGPDNTVYAGDFSTAAATVWGFNPDLSPTGFIRTSWQSSVKLRASRRAYTATFPALLASRGPWQTTTWFSIPPMAASGHNTMASTNTLSPKA
jgi:hypothetical protein